MNGCIQYKSIDVDKLFLPKSHRPQPFPFFLGPGVVLLAQSALSPKVPSSSAISIFLGTWSGAARSVSSFSQSPIVLSHFHFSWDLEWCCSLSQLFLPKSHRPQPFPFFLGPGVVLLAQSALSPKVPSSSAISIFLGTWSGVARSVRSFSSGPSHSSSRYLRYDFVVSYPDLYLFPIYDMKQNQEKDPMAIHSGFRIQRDLRSAWPAKRRSLVVRLKEELGGEATAPVRPNRASDELLLQRLGLGSGGGSLVSRFSSPRPAKQSCETTVA
nr:hypothetical protein Iba_chr10cCG8260 [Ipomoea batatas]